MDDWHVTIWYHDPDRPKDKPFPWVRDEHLHIVTGEAARRIVEPFGIAFVAFLQDGAGTKFKPTTNPTEFTSTGKSINDEMSRRYRAYRDSKAKGLS